MRTTRRMRLSARLLTLLTVVALVAAMVPVMSAAAIPPPATTWYVDADAASEGSGAVDDPFRSISSALATATAGDSIEVAPGTYGAYETFPLSVDTSLLIYSTDGSEVTVIDGDGAPGPLVLVQDGTGSGVAIEGFTITGAAQPEVAEDFLPDGGGISVNMSQVMLSDLVITGNDAAFGAGINSIQSLVEMYDCVISGNGSHTPELEILASVDPLVDSPLTSGTRAGGGIYAVGSMIIAGGCEITGNLADYQGAGMFVLDSLAGTIRSTIADNRLNEVEMQDVAIGAWDSESATVENGVSRSDGGGVYAAFSWTAFVETVFSGNVGEFGAIAAEYSRVEVLGCEITDHEGFAAIGYFDVVSPPEIGEVTAGVEGRLSDADRPNVEDMFAAIENDGLMSTEQLAVDQMIDIVYTTFTGNTGETVMLGYGGDLWMENCLFAENDILYPTVGLQDAYANILHTTMVDNGSEGSLWASGSMSDVYVVSSVLWDAAAERSDPTPADMAPTILWQGNFGLLFDDLRSPDEYIGSVLPEAMEAYDGVIFEDPRFMDSASGDYRLALGSPCVDTAFPLYSPSDDLVGNPRPVDGDGDGEALPDMGAYEYIPGGRFGGYDRYATAVQIVEENFDSAETVVIATGEKFADGLSASALCGLYEAPLLITRSSELTPGVAEEIARLGASKAIIVGSAAAVSLTVEQALEDLGLEITRIGGYDRYETSALIAEHVINNVEFDGRVFVARGDRFPDALAVSPVAYANVIPVLLVRPDRLPESVVEVMFDYDVSSAAVLGSEAAISTDVEVGTQMSLGVLTERIGGADRYETAALISEWANDNGLATFGTVGMTTGLDFPDALCGGAGIGTRGGVLLLTPATSLCAPAADALDAHSGDVDYVQFFGGPNALSAEVEQAVHDVLGW